MAIFAAVAWLRLGIGISLLVSLCWTRAEAEESPTTIVVYARHTFRGVSKAVPPETIDLPQIGFRFAPPLFAWGMDAMPEGLRIAEKVYPRGLRAGVAMAGDAVGANELSQHWDLIRPDLGASRDFETALYLRRGLGGNIPLVGVPCPEGKSRDHVTQFSLSAFGSDESAQSGPDATAEEHGVLRHVTGTFLSDFREIIGETAPSPGNKPLLPPGEKAQAGVFREAAKLATVLEMASAKGPPLQVLFDRSSGKCDVENLILAGLKVIAGRWLIANPGPLGDAQGWFPIHHIDQLPPGSRQILVGHDTQLFFILRALGLISLGEDFADGPVLPMESAIFAFHGNRVAIVRLQLQLRRDGSAGAFQPTLVWQGTRAEWDARVARLRASLESTPATARLLRTYHQPEPIMLKVDQE